MIRTWQVDFLASSRKRLSGISGGKVFSPPGLAQWPPCHDSKNPVVRISHDGQGIFLLPEPFDRLVGKGTINNQVSGVDDPMEPVPPYKGFDCLQRRGIGMDITHDKKFLHAMRCCRSVVFKT